MAQLQSEQEQEQVWALVQTVQGDFSAGPGQNHGSWGSILRGPPHPERAVPAPEPEPGSEFVAF